MFFTQKTLQVMQKACNELKPATAPVLHLTSLHQKAGADMAFSILPGFGNI